MNIFFCRSLVVSFTVTYVTSSFKARPRRFYSFAPPFPFYLLSSITVCFSCARACLLCLAICGAACVCCLGAHLFMARTTNGSRCPFSAAASRAGAGCLSTVLPSLSRHTWGPVPPAYSLDGRHGTPTTFVSSLCSRVLACSCISCLFFSEFGRYDSYSEAPGPGNDDTAAAQPPPFLSYVAVSLVCFVLWLCKGSSRLLRGKTPRSTHGALRSARSKDRSNASSSFQHEEAFVCVVLVGSCRLDRCLLVLSCSVLDRFVFGSRTSVLRACILVCVFSVRM